MHVLQVAWEYPPRLFGGLGRHVEGLVGALAADGTAVTVLTPVHDGPEEAPTGVRVLRAAAPEVPLPAEHWLPEVLDANAAMAERALQEGVAADVLHVHDWMAGHAARVLAPALDVPVVLTIHATERGRHMGHLPPGFSGWIDAQERVLVAASDAVIVCAQHMADHVVTHLGADPARLRVIPNGVDVAAWSAGPDPGTPSPLPRVVFAGRLEHEKGVHVLLEATDGLACEVVIAGEGTFASALRRRAHRRARFVGHLPQPELAALLRTATVVAVPSLYEPFGLAALEAMAAGVPVVASRTGGLAEVLGDGTGVLVPPDDVGALREALTRVLRDTAGGADLRKRGAARAAAFSWEAAAGLTSDVYDTLAP